MSQKFKTALITGATSGIGLAFAEILAKRGTNLVMVARNNEKLHNLKKELELKFKIEVEVLRFDLTDPEAVSEIIDLLEKKEKRIDLLINNAGFGLYGKYLDLDLEQEVKMINLNILALVKFTKLLLAKMVKRKSGSIINVASVAAFQPGPLMAVYYASKAFVLNFTEAIAEEMSDSGVKIMALCPGATASGFQSVSGMGESKVVKGKRLPSAEKVANFALNSLEKGKVVAIHGFTNRLLIFLERFLTRKQVRKLVMRMQAKS